MPASSLKSFAKKAGVSMATAETKWEEAKAIVRKEYSEDDPKFWGTVVKITKNKLGLKESIIDRIDKYLGM